jgi:hypothetical protein
MQPENISEKIKLYRNQIRKVKIKIYFIHFLKYLPIFILLLPFLIGSNIWITLIIAFIIVTVNWSLKNKLKNLLHKKYINELTLIAYRIENGEKFKAGSKDDKKFKELGEILKN